MKHRNGNETASVTYFILVSMTSIFNTKVLCNASLTSLSATSLSFLRSIGIVFSLSASNLCRSDFKLINWVGSHSL